MDSTSTPSSNEKKALKIYEPQHKILLKDGSEIFFPSSLKRAVFDALLTNARFIEIGGELVPWTEIKRVKEATQSEVVWKDFPLSLRHKVNEIAKSKLQNLNLEWTEEDKIQMAKTLMARKSHDV